MKKVQSLAVLLGVAVIFTGTVTVLARTKLDEKPETKVEVVKNKGNENEKEVSGQFDYFFNDGSMDRKWYKKQQNEAKEIEPGKEEQFNNKTNVNHILAFYVISREAVIQSLIDLLNRKGVKTPKTCEIEQLVEILSAKSGFNITKKDIDDILLYFGMCITSPGMIGDFGVLGTQIFNVREEAYDFLKMVFKKIINIKLTDGMIKNARKYATKLVKDKLKDRTNREKEIVGYEGKEYFENYNNRLSGIVREFAQADFKRVKRACSSFECGERLRDERIIRRSKAKG